MSGQCSTVSGRVRFDQVLDRPVDGPAPPDAAESRPVLGPGISGGLPTRHTALINAAVDIRRRQTQPRVRSRGEKKLLVDGGIEPLERPAVMVAKPFVDLPV